VGYVLKVAYKHDVAMKALRTDDEIATFLDELMAAGWEYTAATVYAVPEDSDMKPDHEMTVGADAENGLGAVRWTGDGTFYSRGEHTNPNGVEHAYFGTAHNFPADSEVPLTAVRLAMRQLLDSRGERPTAVAWQEVE
jgi:hypothetical protein